jgi:hypothetical protein
MPGVYSVDDNLAVRVSVNLGLDWALRNPAFEGHAEAALRLDLDLTLRLALRVLV